MSMENGNVGEFLKEHKRSVLRRQNRHIQIEI